MMTQCWAHLKKIIPLSLVFLVVFLVFIAEPILADDTWIVKTDSNIKVKLDNKQKKIHVTLNKDSQKNPESIGIVFYNNKKKSVEFELKALDGKLANGGSDTQFRYSGKLSSDAQSYLGFEIRIPFRSKTPRLIRSEDFEKVD